MPKKRMRRLPAENKTAPIPTRSQLRAARALLDCKQERLAHLAGIGLATLRRFEGGEAIGRAQLEAIGRALEEAGVVLVPARTIGTSGALGPGVALRAPILPAAANDAGIAPSPPSREATGATAGRAPSAPWSGPAWPLPKAGAA